MRHLDPVPPQPLQFGLNKNSWVGFARISPSCNSRAMLDPVLSHNRDSPLWIPPQLHNAAAIARPERLTSDSAKGVIILSDI